MIGKEEADQLRRGKCLNAIKKKNKQATKTVEEKLK